MSEVSLLRQCLQSGHLYIRGPPEPCELLEDPLTAADHMKTFLLKHDDCPGYVDKIIRDILLECSDHSTFRHLLFPNIQRIEEDNLPRIIPESVFRILLNVTPLQDKIFQYLFDRAINFALEGVCGPWIKMFLQNFSALDYIVIPENVATKLIDLLDVASEKTVRLEIISAIPDIIGGQQHDGIGLVMSRILVEHDDLTPAVLDCLSYLCLSDYHFTEIQMRTMAILRRSVQYQYFPNFVKFILIPGRPEKLIYDNAVKVLRQSLSWPEDLSEEICSSQILTVAEIRNSMTTCKSIATAWFKCVSMCERSNDQKEIDWVIMLILYSTTDERQRMVENLIRKYITLNVIKTSLIDKALQNFLPIFKHYLQNMLDMLNNLLKFNNDTRSSLLYFTTYWYTAIFTNLYDCRQTITAVLLQHSLNCKQSLPGALLILKNIAERDISMLKPQGVRMLALLDKVDNLNLSEIRTTMGLLCGLAFVPSDSLIKDDMHMVIKKQLESSNAAIKIKGIVAGIQAVKYLIQCEETGDNDVEKSDEINYSSYTHLAEGDTREAAQIIELICRSTKLFPDLLGFFYDELSEVLLYASHINASFLSWLTDAVTNDLQENFLVSSLPCDKMNGIGISMQYSLNKEDELECDIAINIAEHVFKENGEDKVDISILPSLCRLVQILHSSKSEGDLGDIDALLGCAVIMPKVDLQTSLDDIDIKVVFKIIDCLVHCNNWFRELINGFAKQKESSIKEKILLRIQDIDYIENIINNILLNINLPYKPPSSSFNVSKYIKENKGIKMTKNVKKNYKRPKLDDSNLPTTFVSQPVNISNQVKCKQFVTEGLFFRPLNFNTVLLLDADLTFEDKKAESIDLRSFKFVLKYVNEYLKGVFISDTNKTNHFTKQRHSCSLSEVEYSSDLIQTMLPKFVKHLQVLSSRIIAIKNKSESEETKPEMVNLQMAFEFLLSTIATYFKWIEFKNPNQAYLLQKSWAAIVSSSEEAIPESCSYTDLCVLSIKTFRKFYECCVLASTAVAFIEVVHVWVTLSGDVRTRKITSNLSKTFLSKRWISVEGTPEKGLIYNQYINFVGKIYFEHMDLDSLKNLINQLKNELHKLTGKNDHFDSLKSVSKSNFTILYRYLIMTLHDCAKSQSDRRLTDRESLQLWKDVSKLLRNLSEMAKIMENRNNLSVFLKKSQPLLKLFITQGMPIMEIQLTHNSIAVIEIFKELQYSTKFLQSLCCHSRLKSDGALMAKVPQVRLLLEQFIYKVKAALAANKCSEAFWMGNLKNKNLQGEVIVSQEVAEEVGDDSDDQLPPDDSDDDTDMLQPDSKSISDIN